MRIGAYEVVGTLGRGGMGVVHRARDPRLDREVALKVMAETLDDPSARRRFVREVRLAARVADHPGICGLHHAGVTADGRLYYAMELLEGEALADRIERGPLPPRWIARFVAGACHAVEHAHAEGIIHRDLGPRNLFVGPGDRPVVLDFGLARPLGEVSRLTATGAILGTPSFMAPEQAGGEETTPRTDVYGLGASLYAGLTGRPPVEPGPLPGLLYRVLERAPEPPRSLVEEVPPGMEAICLRALAKDPADRPPSAAALRAELEAVLEGEPVRSPAPSSRSLLSRTSRASRPVGLLLVGTLLAIGAALALLPGEPDEADRADASPTATGPSAGRDGPGEPGAETGDLGLRPTEEAVRPDELERRLGDPAEAGPVRAARFRALLPRGGGEDAAPDPRNPFVLWGEAERLRLARHLGEHAAEGEGSVDLEIPAGDDHPRTAAVRIAALAARDRDGEALGDGVEPDSLPPVVRRVRARLRLIRGEPHAALRLLGGEDSYLRELAHILDGRPRRARRALVGVDRDDPRHDEARALRAALRWTESAGAATLAPPATTREAVLRLLVDGTPIGPAAGRLLARLAVLDLETGGGASLDLLEAARRARPGIAPLPDEAEAILLDRCLRGRGPEGDVLRTLGPGRRGADRILRATGAWPPDEGRRTVAALVERVRREGPLPPALRVVAARRGEGPMPVEEVADRARGLEVLGAGTGGAFLDAALRRVADPSSRDGGTVARLAWLAELHGVEMHGRILRAALHPVSLTTLGSPPASFRSHDDRTVVDWERPDGPGHLGWPRTGGGPPDRMEELFRRSIGPLARVGDLLEAAGHPAGLPIPLRPVLAELRLRHVLEREGDVAGRWRQVQRARWTLGRVPATGAGSPLVRLLAAWVEEKAAGLPDDGVPGRADPEELREDAAEAARAAFRALEALDRGPGFPVPRREALERIVSILEEGAVPGPVLEEARRALAEVEAWAAEEVREEIVREYLAHDERGDRPGSWPYLNRLVAVDPSSHAIETDDFLTYAEAGRPGQALALLGSFLRHGRWQALRHHVDDVLGENMVPAPDDLRDLPVPPDVDGAIGVVSLRLVDPRSTPDDLVRAVGLASGLLEAGLAPGPLLALRAMGRLRLGDPRGALRDVGTSLVARPTWRELPPPAVDAYERLPRLVGALAQLRLGDPPAAAALLEPVDPGWMRKQLRFLPAELRDLAEESGVIDARPDGGG